MPALPHAQYLKPAAGDGTLQGMNKFLGVIAMFLASVISLHAAGTPAKPNIIVILADDIGYGDLSCYGAKLVKTRCSTASRARDGGSPTPIRPRPPVRRRGGRC